MEGKLIAKSKFNVGLMATPYSKRRSRCWITAELRQREAINYETMEKETMYTFTASGTVQHHYGGQCIDTIYKGIKALTGKCEMNFNTLKLINDVWEEYHLNDLTAGTKKQMDFLEHNKIVGYENSRMMLETAGLLEDNGYKYGHGWLCKPIPEHIVNDLKEVLEAY